MDIFVDDIIESLRQGEKVTVAGFGRFEMRERKTKAYTNPKTKVASRLEPTSIPGFRASGLMKQRIASKK
ncbi:MAG: HU family DNA-binding protein [Oscillospiraceae bacterium]